jgi:hypothetical protein
VTPLPQLYTRAEAAEHLRMADRTFRRLIAGMDQFAGRRMKTFTEYELGLIREANECQSTSSGGARVSGTRLARSARAVKASSSPNTAQAAAHELMLNLLRRSETGKSESASSKASRHRS